MTASINQRGFVIHEHEDHNYIELDLDAPDAEKYVAWYNANGFPWTGDSPAWTPDDSQAASLEGWDLFDSAGSVSGPWQIQHFDVPGEIDGGVDLDSDEEAWRIVVENARAGSELHLKVLTILAHDNPLELFSITKTLDVDAAGLARAAVTVS